MARTDLRPARGLTALSRPCPCDIHTRLRIPRVAQNREAKLYQGCAPTSPVARTAREQEPSCAKGRVSRPSGQGESGDPARDESRGETPGVGLEVHLGETMLD